MYSFKMLKEEFQTFLLERTSRYQDTITVVQSINLCKLLNVPEKQNNFVVYFAILQESCFYIKFYLPEINVIQNTEMMDR